MRIYLASPFNHKHFWIRWYRVYVATKCAAKLMKDGYRVFSPLTHSFFIALFLSKELMCDHDFWMEQDLPFVDDSDCVVVVSNETDWKLSSGVTAEVRRACEQYKPFFVFTKSQIMDGCYRQILKDCVGQVYYGR